MARGLGVPAEVMDGERRIALDTPAVAMLTAAGLKVRVERGAGRAAGFADAEYRAAGADMVDDPDEVWGAGLIVKAREPLPGQWRHFRRGIQLFGYLHLAAGAAHLAQGSGTLLGGSAGVPPARVVVVGTGVAGTMAARGARGTDAEVTGVDVSLERGRFRRLQLAGTVTATLASSPMALGEAVAGADLVVGAALVPGARAPTPIDAEQASSMSPGSVIVDLAIDQGGCVETSGPTSLPDRVYEDHGVVHCCVTDVPGQFPRTASRALSAAVVPRVRQLALGSDPPLLSGSLNVADGRVVRPVAAAALEASQPAA